MIGTFQGSPHSFFTEFSVRVHCGILQDPWAFFTGFFSGVRLLFSEILGPLRWLGHFKDPSTHFSLGFQLFIRILCGIFGILLDSSLFSVTLGDLKDPERFWGILWSLFTEFSSFAGFSGSCWILCRIIGFQWDSLATFHWVFSNSSGSFAGFLGSCWVGCFSIPIRRFFAGSLGSSGILWPLFRGLLKDPVQYFGILCRTTAFRWDHWGFSVIPNSNLSFCPILWRILSCCRILGLFDP